MKKIYLLLTILFLTGCSDIENLSENNQIIDNESEVITTEMIEVVTEPEQNESLNIDNPENSYSFNFLLSIMPELKIEDKLGFFAENSYSLYFTVGKSIYRLNRETLIISKLLEDSNITQYYPISMHSFVYSFDGSNTSNIICTKETPENAVFYFYNQDDVPNKSINKEKYQQYIDLSGDYRDSNNIDNRVLPIQVYKNINYQNPLGNLNYNFASDIYIYLNTTNNNCDEKYKNDINQFIDKDYFDMIINLPIGSLICVQSNNAYFYMIISGVTPVGTVTVYFADDTGKVNNINYDYQDFINNYQVLCSFKSAHELNQWEQFNDILQIKYCPCGANIKYRLQNKVLN